MHKMYLQCKISFVYSCSLQSAWTKTALQSEFTYYIDDFFYMDIIFYCQKLNLYVILKKLHFVFNIFGCCTF